MKRNWYQITLYSGSLINPNILDTLPHKIKRKLKNPNWGHVVEVYVNKDQLKTIQRSMVKHYTGPEPWYTSGKNLNQPDEIICAFGADDGENGKVFVFSKGNLSEYKKMINYGKSKGIPVKVMDFLTKISP